MEQFEVEKIKLSARQSPAAQSDKFIASREVQLVPNFHEVKVYKYLQHLEKLAETL